MSDEPDPIPIFPLSNVVLFPRVKTPLHLFEPRYRQLARDALDGARRIAMVVVRPEHADDMAGNPPIYPVGCVGIVTESQRLPNGRYNIILAGEYRVRIVGESAPEGERLYRIGHAVRLEERYPEAERERVSQLRAAITRDVGMIVHTSKVGRKARFDAELFAGVDDETFVNAVANAFAFPAEDKQSLLEADSIPERFGRLASALSFQRIHWENGGGGSSGRVH